METPETTRCLDCDGEVELDAAGTFVFANDASLCAECALRRGGTYDSDRDRWTTEPEVDDLPDQNNPS